MYCCLDLSAPGDEQCVHKQVDKVDTILDFPIVPCRATHTPQSCRPIQRQGGFLVRLAGSLTRRHCLLQPEVRSPEVELVRDYVF